MMVDAGVTIASGMDHLETGDVDAAQADYELVRETYPADSEWMMDGRLRRELHALRDGIRYARRVPAQV